MVSLHVCMCSCFSRVWLFLATTLGTIARQVPLSSGILQARILEWVSMPSSRGSSRPRDWTLVYLHLPVLQLDSLTTEPPGKPPGGLIYYQIKCQPVASGTLQKNIKNIYKEYKKVIRIIGGYTETISQKNLYHRSVAKRSSVLFNGSPDWARLTQGNNPV